MAKLIGSQLEAASATTNNAEVAQAFQFTSEAEGTVTEIEVHSGTTESTATSLKVAICKEGAEKPGAVLSGGEGTFASKPPTNEPFKITGLSASVEASPAKYWLVFLPLGGTFKHKRTATGTPSLINTTPAKAKTVTEVTVWGTNQEHGPMWIAGLGTTGGIVQTSPKVEIQLEVKAVATGGSGAYNIAAKVESQLEVLTEVQSPGNPSEKEENLYYGPSAEKAAEEAASTHNRRYLDAWGAPVAGAATIVTIHGGGLGPGNRNEVEAVPKRLNERGYCVFSIDYRYASTSVGALGEGTAETARTLSDVEEAITYAKTHAELHNGNPNNIYVLGGSAGGLIGALAAIKMNSTETKVKGVITFSGYFDIKAYFEEMESGKYNEPSGGHAGGSANNVIEHTQWGFQQELNYTNSSGEGTGPPVVTFATKTSAAGDRTVQKNKSPNLLTIAKPIRWFTLYYKEDLIPAVQQTGYKTHLETEKQAQIKVHEQNAVGHGWGMFANNTFVRTEVFEFIEAAFAAPVVEMGLEVKATFTGVESGGGTRAPFLEIATVGKHSKIRTRT